jgi:hypothetical protein
MKRWLLLGAILCFSSGVALASPLCTNGTLQDYINLGAGGCQFGNAVFSNFSFAYSSNDGTTGASPGKGAGVVPVTPDPSGGVNDPGLQFGPTNLTPAAGFFEDDTFKFTVTAAAGFLLDDASLEMTGAFFLGVGAATTAETLLPAGDPQTNLQGFFTDSNTNNKTSQANYTATSSLTVSKDVRVTNTSSPPGLFDLSAVTNDFSLIGGDSPVPEPMTAASIGLGLCWLAFNLRKRGKKS